MQALYAKVKEDGITYEQVRDFVKDQEIYQLCKKQTKPKHYFPIVAKHAYEIWQMDLMDMSDLASSNGNIKYILVAVFLHGLQEGIGMTNKYAKSVVDCMKDLMSDVMLGKPKIINCDNGSEFINRDFQKLCSDNGIEIRFVEVGDHHKLGIIDRFIRTLREKINK